MKVTTTINDTFVHYFIEREEGLYNNVSLNIPFPEGLELTDDELKTYCYREARDTAVRVFEQIEPLNERDNLDFVPVQPEIRSISASVESEQWVNNPIKYSIYSHNQYGESLYIETGEYTPESEGLQFIPIKVDKLECTLEIYPLERPLSDIEILRADMDFQNMIIDEQSMIIQQQKADIDYLLMIQEV